MNIEIETKGIFKSIQEFKIMRDIGIGSFGKVKLALHRGTQRKYALKIISNFYFIVDIKTNKNEVEMKLLER